MQRIGNSITRLLGSRGFYYGVLIFFGLESLWVAISAVYPMAFDEDFHFGLIKLYSHHWLPFLSAQPDGASTFGAVARDPSYLYHYLMSFPYRLVALVTDSQTAQVIVLRLFNIVFFGLALVLFRKVLRRADTSPALTHLALALFVLVPIVPMLAGQINYDNLLLPLVAWICLLAGQILEQLKTRQITLRTYMLFLSVGLLASLVTHVFLPILVVAAGFVAASVWLAFRGRSREFRRRLSKNYHLLSSGMKLGLAALLLLSMALFVQRDGVNVIQYHTPVPECDQIMDEEACQDYGPWARNDLYAKSRDSELEPQGTLTYTGTWLTALHYRSFFAVSGPGSSYTNYPPLPLPSAVAIVIAVSGTVALALYFRQVFSGRLFLLFLFAIVVGYLSFLWVEDRSQYLYTGQPVAINGRYLLIILLPAVAIIGRAFTLALRPVERLKPFIAAVVVLLFLQGGGVLTFIARSDASWDWPVSWVVRLNDGARAVLKPVLIQPGKNY